MQGTAGFFSTVNTRETNWILTEQERRGYKEEKVWEYQYKLYFKNLHFRDPNNRVFPIAHIKTFLTADHFQLGVLPMVASSLEQSAPDRVRVNQKQGVKNSRMFTIRSQSSNNRLCSVLPTE